MQLKILLSLDHELSLGGAESYARNLFDPTEQVMCVAEELQVPLTLFTDVCCAMRFENWDYERFCRPYRQQLRRALAAGHDVQLHLHPHWLDSDYENGRFTPSPRYTLGAFADQESPNDIAGIVERGIGYLVQLCRHQCPDYRCIAYRGGGFSLAPHTAAILSALYEQGIRIDSTIAKGNRLASKLWEVDHRGMPGQANWYIAATGPLNQAADEGLYEIPIAARPRTSMNNIPFLVKRVVYRRRQYDSGGWSIDVGHTSPLGKLKRLFPASAWLLGFDNHTQSVGDLMKILHHHLRSHRQDEFIACSAISHPKFMGPHARDLMKQFVERTRREFGGQLEFCTYQQFWEKFLIERTSQRSLCGT